MQMRLQKAFPLSSPKPFHFTLGEYVGTNKRVVSADGGLCN